MAINRLNPDYPDAGFVQLMPSSVAVGSGSSTVSGNGEVSFSGVSSVSLNDVFSSAYNTYRIIFYRDSTVTAASGTYLRLRVSGSDLASGYNYAKVGVKSNNTTQTFYITGATEMGLVDSADSTGKAVIIDVANPFRSTSGTDKTFQFSGMGVTGGLNAWFNTYGWVDSATSYTGFSLTNDTGTMTGSVSVYGYRN